MYQALFADEEHNEKLNTTKVHEVAATNFENFGRKGSMDLTIEEEVNSKPLTQQLPNKKLLSRRQSLDPIRVIPLVKTNSDFGSESNDGRESVASISSATTFSDATDSGIDNSRGQGKVPIIKFTMFLIFFIYLFFPRIN